MSEGKPREEEPQEEVLSDKFIWEAGDVVWEENQPLTPEEEAILAELEKEED